MKKILITGINGFLGTHLANHLGKGYEIIGLANSLKVNNRLIHPDIKIFKSTDENIDEIFNSNEVFAVIHAATVYKKKKGSLLPLLRANIELPLRLYELCNQYKVKYFINTDTFFNFTNSSYSYLSEYTLSKKQILEWLLALQESCILVNMKLYHMYGPYDAESKFIPSIISRIKNNEIAIDLTPGNQKRDFIYVEDVCEAYAVILKNLDCSENQSVFHEYEVGTGKVTSIKELVEKIKEVSESTSELRFGKLDYRQNEIMEAVAKNQKIKDLGWKPKTSLDRGLKKIIFNE